MCILFKTIPLFRLPGAALGAESPFVLGISACGAGPCRIDGALLSALSAEVQVIDSSATASPASNYAGLVYCLDFARESDDAEVVLGCFEYDDEGYQIKINYSGMVLNVNKFFKKLTRDGYSKTVITRKDTRGVSYYIYNPNRDGD